MSDPRDRTRLSAVLFFLAAAGFFVSAMTGDAPTFYALAAVFIALGAAMLARSRRKD